MTRKGPAPKAGGRREQLLARVPTEDAQAYREMAKEAGLPVTDWVALTLAQATGRPAPEYVLDALADTRTGNGSPTLFAAAS